jgi:hypothetical protein
MRIAARWLRIVSETRPFRFSQEMMRKPREQAGFDWPAGKSLLSPGHSTTGKSGEK